MRVPALAGVGTALVTPFQGAAVDHEALTKLVRAQLAVGVDFLVPCGTTGESPTLTDDDAEGRRKIGESRRRADVGEAEIDRGREERAQHARIRGGG